MIRPWDVVVNDWASLDNPTRIGGCDFCQSEICGIDERQRRHLENKRRGAACCRQYCARCKAGNRSCAGIDIMTPQRTTTTHRAWWVDGPLCAALCA